MSSLLYKWRKVYSELGSDGYLGKGNLKLTAEQKRIYYLKHK